jgi:hypothetical protein
LLGRQPDRRSGSAQLVLGVRDQRKPPPQPQ